MPSKNAVIMQTAVAFAQGCGSVPIDEAAYEWFQARYIPWIDTKKAVGTTPREVWAQHGPEFLGRFRLIGKRAAASGATITEETLKTSATSVEQESECPWCPDEP